MSTPILKVISEYCSVYIHDQQLQALAIEDPPLYARKAWGYLRAAIPLFNMPAEMPIYLLGTPNEPKYTEPKYDDTIKVITEEITEDRVIELGADFVGYDLFACREQQQAGGNIVFSVANNVTYDAATGEITVHATESAPVPAGTVYNMDFYTDGAFDNTLSHEIMNILGLCFAIVWENHFMNDWVSMIPKVEDRSFTTQNQANKIRADSERLIVLTTQASQQMRRFEQALEQRTILPAIKIT